MIRSPAGFDGGDRIKRYLDYYQPSYGVMMLSAGQFSPASLFAAGEQGAWYDPSDFTTMFQDSAGTTPVTAVEQPVGLLLDKSKGLALGSEIASTFTVTTDWTFGSGTVTGLGTAGGGTATSGVASVANTWYKITYTKTGTSGLFQVRIGNAFVTTDGGAGAATRTYYAAAANTAGLVFTNSGSYSGTITGISCVAISGNHASQSTSASRPVLSARVNLLTYSEQFDNAAWSKGLITVTGDAIAGPFGGVTADKLGASAVASPQQCYQIGLTFTAISYTFSFYAKAAGSNWVAINAFDGVNRYTYFDLQNGVVGTVAAGDTASISAVGSGWYRCAVTRTASPTASGGLSIELASANNSPGNVSVNNGVYAWGADIRVTNDGVVLPAYQRVAAATDYDTTGFPLYLRFDGTDDSLATASVNFSVTDKMSVFSGVRKLSNAAAIVVELSAATGGNDGSFYFLSGTDSGFSYGSLSRGTAVISGTQLAGVTVAAPDTAVISSTHDIGGSLTTFRRNQNASANATGTKGTGNFGNYPLYIGRRGGTTLPYNGRLYSLIVRGAQSTDAQIASTETWVDGKTGAY
jgi:hypothetical protein